MAVERPKEIRVIKSVEHKISLDRKSIEARKKINKIFVEKLRAEKNKELTNKRKQFIAEYSKKRIDELGLLSESVAKEIQVLRSKLKKGQTGILFGEKRPKMERKLAILSLQLDSILSVRQQKLRSAQILHNQKREAIKRAPSAESEVRKGMGEAGANIQRVIPRRNGNVRASGQGEKTSGQVRIVDRNGNVVKPKGTPSGARVKTTEPVIQLPNRGRSPNKEPMSTPEPKRSDFMQQEVVPKQGESRGRGVQGELDLRVRPKKGQEKTQEQTQAETIFITFITENPNFRARFTEFNQFFEWVKTTFNFTDARQTHQTIINLFNNPESVSSIKVLIQTQQTVINILKGVKGSKLSEEDLKRIADAIQKSEARLTGQLKLTREELVKAITDGLRDNRLLNANVAAKIIAEISNLEGKVDKMSESLDEILREVLARKGLTPDEKKAFAEEFTLLRSLIFEATKNLQDLSARNMTTLLNVLTRIEARIPNTAEFNQVLELSLTKIIATNNQTLITQLFKAPQMKKWKGRYTQILERFAEVRNLIRELDVKVKDVPLMIEKLEQFLSDFTKFTETTNLNFQRITEAIEALKPLTEEQIKTILEKVIEEADLPKKVLEKMQDYFKNNPEFGDVIRAALEEKFTAIENKMDTIRDELKTAIENSGLPEWEKEAFFNKLTETLNEVREAKTLSQESRDMLLKLKEKFPDDKTLEEIMKPILETTILENNEKIQQMLVDMGLAKSSEIADLKSSLEERLAALEEKIDEKGDKGDKGDDGKGGKDGKGETETGGDPAKKDPEPGFWKKAGMMLNKNLGGSLLLIAIIVIVYAAIVAAQKAPTKIAQNYSITPVFGETLKTASTTSSSLLGSLGGINPLIIIGVVVVLFLLFPKK